MFFLRMCLKGEVVIVNNFKRRLFSTSKIITMGVKDSTTHNADLEMESIFRHAIVDKGLLNDDCPSIDLFDIDYFRARIASLRKAFPEDFFLHAMALKGNSFRGVIRIAMENGMGGECASLPEAIHSLSVGLPPNKVVFDSPCKTKADIKKAIEAGVVMNLDNEHEAEMADNLLKNECQDFTPGTIGIRINPVVGGGKMDMVSTATKLSKFGVPLTEDTKERVIGLYKKYEWLNQIHFHVGSQGVPIELFVNGAKVVMDFVEEIEKSTGRSLAAIDIGGGLSTSYVDSNEPDDFAYQRYRSMLNEKAPELFSGKYRVITEFGRSLLLKAGKSLTRINYVKQWLPEVQPMLMTHLGTNQFIREVYIPHLWNHRYSLLDAKSGKVKQGQVRKYDIAGPLCFQGDFLAKDLELPEAVRGDILVVHDTGGYSMSMYSKYNSITPSAVYGYERDESGSFRIRCFKERETAEETLAFWGNPYPRPVN